MNKIRTFQAGTLRKRGEGLRIGAVRYLPRGAKKKDYLAFLVSLCRRRRIGRRLVYNLHRLTSDEMHVIEEAY